VRAVIELTLRHELHCTPERHWKLFFDPEWTRTLILEGLGFNKCEVGPLQTHGDTTERSMRVEPKIDVPGPVARLLGPRLGYNEVGKFHEPTQVWTYELRLSVLSEKIQMGGEVTLQPQGDDRCTRTSKLWMRAKIPVIGGMVERAAEKNMRDGWDKSATWINGWLDANPAAPAD
jgi:hypothetical protein